MTEHAPMPECTNPDCPHRARVETLTGEREELFEALEMLSAPRIRRWARNGTTDADERTMLLIAFARADLAIASRFYGTRIYRPTVKFGLDDIPDILAMGYQAWKNARKGTKE